MFYQLFKETQDEHNVSNKELIQETGISGKHLSQFRSGTTSISLEMLWKLVEALDRLSPGAKKDFGLKLAGPGVKIDIEYIFSRLSPTDLLALLGSERFALLVRAFADSISGVPSNPSLSHQDELENTSEQIVEEPVSSVPVRNNGRKKSSRTSNKEYEEVLAS